MKVNSVKGTFDYLPKEAKIRGYLQDKILETYTSCGFERIITTTSGRISMWIAVARY